MDSDCESTGLSLGLIPTNLRHTENKEKSTTQTLPSVTKLDHLSPSLSLAPAGSDDHPISPTPASMSFDIYSGCVKRTTSFQEEREGSPRKKLRLTKHQSDVLEDSFKDHPTLSLTQKQALAKDLNLRPRQVEVWFQNRRARTKLKQTETECELLRKRCEKLTEDNKRLHKELHELKSMQLCRLFMD